MGRRQAREAAMQVLYMVEIGQMPVEDAFRNLQENFPMTAGEVKFARQLVNGTLDRLAELDSIIARYSRDWCLDRMAAVDRNILRLALFEMLYIDDIPFNVTINEAVEVAKVYGGDKSGKFINGILDAVVHSDPGHRPG